MSETKQKYTKEQAIALVEECYDSGEPIFIVRTKDIISWKIVKRYAEMLKDAALREKFAEKDSPSYDLAEQAELLSTKMLYWQGENQDKIKLPD